MATKLSDITSPRTFLCVGGPIDGELRAIVGSVLWVPVMGPRCAAYWAPESPSAEPLQLFEHKYIPYRFPLSAAVITDLALPADAFMAWIDRGFGPHLDMYAFRCMAWEPLVREPEIPEERDLYDDVIPDMALEHLQALRQALRP